MIWFNITWLKLKYLLLTFWFNYFVSLFIFSTYYIIMHSKIRIIMLFSWAHFSKRLKTENNLSPRKKIPHVSGAWPFSWPRRLLWETVVLLEVVRWLPYHTTPSTTHPHHLLSRISWLLNARNIGRQHTCDYDDCVPKLSSWAIY